MTDEIFFDLLQFIDDEDLARQLADAVGDSGHWLIEETRKGMSLEQLLCKLGLADGQREQDSLAFALGCFARNADGTKRRNQS